MANIDLSKVMNLADGLEMYKDLRDRIRDIPTPEAPVEGLLINSLAMPIDDNGYIKFGVQNGIKLVMDGLGTSFNLEADLQDVQVNGVSILSQGIANIPIAGPNQLGVLKVGSGSRGVDVSQVDNELQISFATANTIKSGSNSYCPITPKYADAAAFYGLARAAGKSMSSVSGATVGVYPDEQKQAIQKMLGLDGLFGDYQNGNTASKAYAVGETFIMDGKRYKVTSAISDGGLITVGTNCEPDPLDGHYVRDTDYATTTKAGLVTCSSTYSYGINIVNDAGASGDIRIRAANSDGVKNGTQNYQPIVPNKQHESVFFGLSKLAGVDLKDETVTVGTYPATAKAAILAMLGAVAEDKKAGSGASDLGLVFAHGNNGVGVSEYGGLYISRADSGHIKAGTNTLKPIVPEKQHEAVFYGLAKAAGDTTQSQSDNAIGTYTANAKTAIQTMLGVSTGAILIENVSGGTPTLTCFPNVRYKCGEVSTLSITPPASGSCEVIFESGSTATLLTVPNTVKFPPWFDATALETGKIYDIIITDGVYGAVMSWES